MPCTNAMLGVLYIILSSLCFMFQVGVLDMNGDLAGFRDPNRSHKQRELVFSIFPYFTL